MKHKHAELIKQWADGAEIQYCSDEGGWLDCYENKPMWNLGCEYRIKPEEKKPVAWMRKPFGEDVQYCEKPFTTDWTPLYTTPQPVQEPVAWNIDADWLKSVLHYADKNPDDFPEIDYESGKYGLDAGDVDALITALNTTPPSVEAAIAETKKKAANVRKEVPLVGIHSEDYEDGFWDALDLYEAAIRSMK
jgi:hypothetical protein